MEAIVGKPSVKDQAQAKKVSKILRNLLLNKPREQSIKVCISASNAQIVEQLPDAALLLLDGIIQLMAEGKKVVVLPSETLVGTQEAANFLRVSRPYLVKLLESGKIPYRKVGRYRRILLDDLVEYDTCLKAIRQDKLRFLAEQAQDLNLGY